LSKHPIVSQEILRSDHLPFPRFHFEDPEPFNCETPRIPLRRSLPDVLVDVKGFGRVRVIALHFKSRRGKEMIGGDAPETTTHFAETEARAIVWRCAEALFVRRAVDEHLSRNPDEMLCVCGDFNDVPESLPLRIVSGTAGVDPRTPRPDRLVSAVSSIPIAERFSVDHEGDPAAIDHALMSTTLAARFSRAFYSRASPPAPSDHAPLIVCF
jgi:endonuclease/exonuclease/phosphatase family metal-dependent hydrolase